LLRSIVLLEKAAVSSMSQALCCGLSIFFEACAQQEMVPVQPRKKQTTN